MIKIHLVQKSGNPLVIKGEIRERKDLYDAWASIPDVSPSGDDPETYWEATQKTFTLLEQILDMPPFAFVEAEGTWEFHPLILFGPFLIAGLYFETGELQFVVFEKEREDKGEVWWKEISRLGSPPSPDEDPYAYVAWWVLQIRGLTRAARLKDMYESLTKMLFGGKP